MHIQPAALFEPVTIGVAALAVFGVAVIAALGRQLARWDAEWDATVSNVASRSEHAWPLEAVRPPQPVREVQDQGRRGASLDPVAQ